MTDTRTDCELWAAGEPSTRSQEVRDFINRKKAVVMAVEEKA